MKKLTVILFLSALALTGCGLGVSAYEDAILDGASSLNRGKLENALEDFNRAIKIDPQAAGGYLGRGNTLNIMARYNDAIADYDKATSIDPSLANAYANRAIAYSHLEKYEQAIADYEKCLQLDPKIDNPPGILKRLFSNESNQERGIRKHLKYLKEQLKKSRPSQAEVGQRTIITDPDKDQKPKWIHSRNRDFHVCVSV